MRMTAGQMRTLASVRFGTRMAVVAFSMRFAFVALREGPTAMRARVGVRTAVMAERVRMAGTRRRRAHAGRGGVVAIESNSRSENTR